MASRSASVMPVSRPLMRTSRRGRCLVAPAFLRNASAASRAAGLRSGTIESSRSTITASAPLARALSSLGPPSAGTKRRERMYRSLLGFLIYPKYRSGARFWRRNYRGLPRRGAVASRRERLLSDRMGSVIEAHVGSRLGAYDSGPSRTGGTAWHQAGYGAADCIPDRPGCGSEKSVGCRQVLRPRHEGRAAAEIWNARRLRAEHRVEHSPLVRLLRPRHLTRTDRARVTAGPAGCRAFFISAASACRPAGDTQRPGSRPA